VIDSNSDWLALFAPHLAIAVAVLEEEHMTRAAGRVGVPQPTVSAVMQRIGQAIGTPLVQSSGRGVVSTAAGRAFLPAAQEALMSLRVARQEVWDVVDPDHGRVALGFVHSRGLRDVPMLLDAFLAAYPDITFTLKQGSVDNLIDLVRSNALDVVIVAPLPDDERFETVVLADDRLYLVVPCDHRFASRRSIALHQAAGETFVALTPGHGLRQILDTLCATAGFTPSLGFEGEDVATLRGLVRAGLGIAVLPAADHPDHGIVEVAVSKPQAHRLLGAVWVKNARVPPAARRFITFLTTSGAQVLRETP
jgi:LysR family transcriptional activator of glutamate synthase operon